MYAKLIYFLVANVYLQTGLGHALPMSIYEQKKYPKHIEAQGLYDASDKVTILEKASFRERVFNQDYASIVEFYNAYCGFCKRYAPTWKAFAADVTAWQGIVQVAAVDCATEDNHDLCREFEIMAYPSIRYFSPHLSEAPSRFGVAIDGEGIDGLREKLVAALRNETTAPAHWPKLHSINDSNLLNVFAGLPATIDYVFVMHLPENSSVAAEVKLDLHSIGRISIVSVDGGQPASDSLAVINRNLEVVPLPLNKSERLEMRTAIEQFAKHRGLKAPAAAELRSSEKPADRHAIEDAEKQQNDIVLAQVKAMAPTVYQADLEQALRYTLFHEIPQFSEITGERMLALQRYISMISRYSPLGPNGRAFLQELHIYVMEATELRGELFEHKLKQLETKWKPLFSANRWVGCQGSAPKLRGFTCGLWVLFHFVSVQAAESETSTDPLETLQAILGYVKYFFGCHDCSEHFQRMAIQERIFSVPSRDDAVLWLWSAHNMVNARLKGDQTEDIHFPKIQFPSVSTCMPCRRLPLVATLASDNGSDDGMEWDKTEVLSYLKRMYAPQNVSRYGIDDETVLPKTIEALREKRLLENVFSDMDMRMCILLYLFCVAMMILAVKLFVKRGYRKKMYSHDFLGKV